MAIEACMQRWGCCSPGSVSSLRAESLCRQAATMDITVESLATADAIAAVQAHTAQSEAAQSAPPVNQPDPQPPRTLVLSCVYEHLRR